MTFPTPRRRMSDNLDAEVYDREIDPRKYYPTDLYREPMVNFPEDFSIDVREVALPKLRHMQEKLKAKEDSCRRSSTP